MEYYFCLDFLYIFLHYRGFTFSKKTHENRSGESRITACQTLWGLKSKFAETQFPNHYCPGS